MAATFPEYESFDGLGLANLVKHGVISATELLTAAIERIETYNPQLNAVIHKMYDQAYDAARYSLPTGLFQCVPLLLKDLLAECKGAPLRFGSRFTEGYISSFDSELVRRLKKSGVIVVGKTNTPEFGLSPNTEPEAFGPAHNPWDVTHTVGGSSGGSAAAVAAGMVPIAHGGDGAGSIRIPAAYCGVFGLKPSRGRTPTGPVLMRIWQGMVVEHVLTRSVRDSAAMLDVLAGPEIGSPIALSKPTFSFLECLDRPPPKLKIAMIEQPFFPAQIDGEYISALKKAAKICENLGHEIDTPLLKINSQDVAKAFLILISGEMAADMKILKNVLGRKPKYNELEIQTAVVCEAGDHFSAADYAWAMQVLDAVTKQVAEFFENYDVIMTPTMAGPPPKIGQFKPDKKELAMLEMLRWVPRRSLLMKFIDRASERNFAFTPYTPLFNITGNPAMSVPLFWDKNNLPIGIQFAGRFGDEKTLFQLARQLEEVRPWGAVALSS